MSDDLSKSIGFITYPKLGQHSPVSAPMELPPTKIPDRYAALGRPAPNPNAAGSVLYNSRATTPTPESRRIMTGFVNTGSSLSLPALRDHESQHTVFNGLKQKFGQDFVKKTIDNTLSVLSPTERKILDHINVDRQSYVPTVHNEELLAHFHNYLQDQTYRRRVHDRLNLSDKGALNLHNLAKSAWKKLRAHAKTIDFGVIQKSEDLTKREPPKFPKLGVPDARKEVEFINDKVKLHDKLQHFAQNTIEWNRYNPGAHSQIKADAKKQFGAIVRQESGNAGAINPSPNRTNIQGYALSGVLRPSAWGNSWRSPIEDGSLGTKQHEEFHSQLARVAEQHGKGAANSLADNLWQALPQHQRAAIEYLQNHATGGLSYKSAASETEEKLARIFNHLNGRDARVAFHTAQSWKIHELPNGELLDNTNKLPEEKQYVVPGLSFHPNQRQFDNIIKDAHRNLIAAASVADENWLRPGHMANLGKSESKSYEAVDHLLGHSHTSHKLCEAARFLSGKSASDAEIRTAMQKEESAEKAILVAHGLEPTDKNVKALLGVVFLGKSLQEEQYHVREGLPENKPTADAIEHGISQGHVEHINLGGKHSGGTLLVESEDNSKYWLIKPESGKFSPADGVSECSASQSEREVAFSKIAEAVGLGHFVPKADLIWLNDKQAAALAMLPFEWRNFDSLVRKNKGLAKEILEPYRHSGDLFKWAILDFVLGQTDRHSGNLMVSPQEDGHKVVLIDHGSTFAGPSFNPGQDSDSWVPCYLRAYVNKWTELTPHQRIESMPNLSSDVEKAVFRWALDINPSTIATIMQKYGIEAGPSLARLTHIKECKTSIDDFVNKLWVL